MAETTIHPLWHDTAGEPYLSGFRVRVTASEREAVGCEFPTTYFKRLAQQAAAQFVAQGALADGATFRYLVRAYPRAAKQQAARSLDLTIEEVPPSLTLKEGSLAEFLRASVPCGAAPSEDVPVFVPERILTETAALKESAGELETGGILIGHLYRDASTRDVFVVVTAQIPARHTQATSTRLRFTAETWTDVQAAIDLRRRDEAMVGWWHSHPIRHWCKCERAKQINYPLAKEFFSEQDVALHRAVFPRAYSVGLVVSDTPSSGPERWTVTGALFGWRRGLVEPRGFHLMENGNGRQRQATAGYFVVSRRSLMTTTEGGDHAQTP